MERLSAISTPSSFEEICDATSVQSVKKLGEGAFGEVFVISREKRRDVFKIMPITDDLGRIPGRMYSEAEITRQLSDLRAGKTYKCDGFVEFVACRMVCGRYPKLLVDSWAEYAAEQKRTRMPDPTTFPDNQLFIVLELKYAGEQMFRSIFFSALQSLNVLRQIVMSLAVAEKSKEFEHRDLHWGNILISRTTDRQVHYVLGGRRIWMPTGQVKATIIDFTLSRIKNSDTGEPIYWDFGELNRPSDDIYGQMGRDVKSIWSKFEPKTNVRWINCILNRLISEMKYPAKGLPCHEDSMKILRDTKEWIESCNSAYEVAYELVIKRCVRIRPKQPV